MDMRHLFRRLVRRPRPNEALDFGKKTLINRIIRYNLLIVMMPVLVLLLFLFLVYQEKQVDFEAREVDSYLDQAYYNVHNNIALMRALALTPMTDETLMDTLLLRELQPLNLLQLKRETVAELQKLKWTNPTIGTVRVYYLHKAMTDMSPSLYSAEQNLPEQIAKSLEQRDNLWALATNDPLAEDDLSDLYAIYYQKLYTLKGDEGGYVEISMKMDKFLSNMSYVDAKNLMGLYLENGALYYDYSSGSQADAAGMWSASIWELMHSFQQQEENQREIQFSDGRRLYVAIRPMEEIGCALFYVRDISEVYRQSGKLVFGFLGSLGGMILLFSLITRRFGHFLLRRMYLLIGSMRQAAEGDMTIRLPTDGQDEIDELIVHFNQMIDMLETLMQANQQRQWIARKAEIQALQNQINTHFLYNTLESIRMMAVIDGNKQVADAVHNLASLLNYTLHMSRTMVSVKEELQNVRDYIDLMQLRWDEEIILHIEVDKEIQGQEICKLTLQPIVENALIHGASPLKSVCLRVWDEEEDNESYCLCIEDRGQGMPLETLENLRRILESHPEEQAEPQSIGLYNVNNRIKLYCGEAYGVRLESEQYRYTRVRIRLPRRKLG